ncbi:MAG: hypothetical protein BWY24_00418 [Microgenomates group bacterium ADurb.Bin219]|nr:MAG: hypothetical protein BWY24_00418 [Microgenomates group bacterium ADurb.Bin219]
MATKKTIERKTTTETTVDDAGKVPAEKPPAVAASVKVTETPPVKKEPAVAVVAPSDPPKATPTEKKSEAVPPSVSTVPVAKPAHVTETPRVVYRVPGYAWALGLLLLVAIAVLLALLVNQNRLARIQRECPEVIAQQTAVSIPVSGVTTIPASECPVVISDRKDQFRVVWDCSRRIWQDSLPDEGTQRVAYEISFTAPVGGNAIFNGVNAVLEQDENKDGTPDKVIAANKNGIVVTLTKGGWYRVKNGTFNGGFEIKFSDPS